MITIGLNSTEVKVKKETATKETSTKEEKVEKVVETNNEVKTEVTDTTVDTPEVDDTKEKVEKEISTVTEE